MQRFLVVGLVLLLCGVARADEARQLRLEAGALVQAAEVADSARKRRALLEEAHGKLLEIQERFSSESARLTLYLGGRRVSLSPEDVAAMVAAAPSADLDIGTLREVLGRMPSPIAVDENGWTDLHWAAALNLPELAEALLDGGADVDAPLKADWGPLSDRLKRSLRDLGLFHLHSRRRGRRPLDVAVLSNARKSATTLIARGADIHAKDAEGWTPLHAAAYGNASEIAMDLIARGADIHAKDYGGATPLHMTAYENASEIATALIAQGAYIHAMDNDGRTSLHQAAMWNAPEVAMALISQGADIDAKDNHGATPLHYATYLARSGKILEVAADLIARGANIHAKTNDGWTPLHAAAFWAGLKNALDVAVELIARGADVHAKNDDGKTPLQLAEEGGHREALEEAVLKRRQQDAARLAGLDVGNLREVLGRELSPTAVDDNGWTDLHWAAVLNLPDLAEALLAAGAKVDPKLKGNGSPPSGRLSEKFHLAGVNAGGGHGFFGETPLHIAAQKNALETAKVLVAGGADSGTALGHAIASDALSVATLLVGLEGAIRGPGDLSSLLDYAATEYAATEVATMLIERGADIHAKVGYNGATPLHSAARLNRSGMAAMLIERGADIDAKDKDGNTPLHRAVWGVHAPSTSSAVVLIERGANIHAKNKSGETPLHLIAKQYDSLIAAMLIERGADVHARDASGETPLQVRELLQSKFEAFSRGGALAVWEQDELDRLLVLGASSDDTEVATLLIELAIERGVDISRSTALHSAVSSSGAKTVAMLIDHGAQPQRKGGWREDTPLHQLADYGEKDVSEIFTMLIERGADIDATDKDGNTPLHRAALAVEYGTYNPFSVEVAAMLIQHGADIHAKNKSGETPLHLVAKDWKYAGSERIAAILIERGADINARDKSGKTPLQMWSKLEEIVTTAGVRSK